MSGIYQFSNGIRLSRGDLLDLQVARYSAPGNPNLHEPVEEEWMQRVIESLATDAPTFLDVGAAVGYYCVLVKKLRAEARVYAVEALPRHIEALANTLKLNGFETNSVTVMPIAVAPRSGSATFVDLSYGSQLANGNEPKETLKFTVPASSLSDVIGKIGKVDLMKMDIQGAERGVLDNSRELLASSRICNIILGTHGQDTHKFTRELLRASGYELLFDDPAPPMQPDGLIVARSGRQL